MTLFKDMGFKKFVFQTQRKVVGRYLFVWPIGMDFEPLSRDDTWKFAKEHKNTVKTVDKQPPLRIAES